MPLRAIKIPNAQGCAAVPFEKKKVQISLRLMRVPIAIEILLTSIYFS